VKRAVAEAIYRVATELERSGFAGVSHRIPLLSRSMLGGFSVAKVNAGRIIVVF